MISLKDNLKAAANLLKTGDNEKVIELLRVRFFTQIFR